MNKYILIVGIGMLIHKESHALMYRRIMIALIRWTLHYENYMLRVYEKHWILLYRRFQIISYDDVIIRWNCIHIWTLANKNWCELLQFFSFDNCFCFISWVWVSDISIWHICTIQAWNVFDCNVMLSSCLITNMSI